MVLKCNNSCNIAIVIAPSGLPYIGRTTLPSHHPFNCDVMIYGHNVTQPVADRSAMLPTLPYALLLVIIATLSLF